MEQEIVESEVNAISYDLNAIIDFIFQNDQKSKSSEIREVWDKSEVDGNLEMIQKSLAEVKNDELSAIANIRYDLVKTLINQINEISMIMDDTTQEELEGLEESETYAGEPVVTTLGQLMAMNTLRREGMIINAKIKDVENDGQE